MSDEDAVAIVKATFGMKCYREGWQFRYQNDVNTITETEEAFHARHAQKDKANPYPKGSFGHSEWWNGWIDCDMGKGRE